MSKEIILKDGTRVIVDDEDFEWISRHDWSSKKPSLKTKPEHTQYAARCVSLPMHREILMRHGHDIDYLEIDHKNGNGFDNRKENLRISTHQQNLRNQRAQKNARKVSPYKGVSIYTRGNYSRWMTRIKHNGKSICIGYFRTEEDAAQAYNWAALYYFGEYAHFNLKESPSCTSR